MYISDISIFQIFIINTARKVSIYRVFSGPHFPVSVVNTEIYLVNLCIQSPNTGKSGSEKVRYLDSFHAVEKQRSIQHPVKHLFYENSKSLRTVNYFHKMVHPRCLTEF